MRNLLQMLRSSGLFAAGKRNRAPSRAGKAPKGSRRPVREQLERRELLASDILASHNYYNPYDVNNDYQITASDALAVINRLSVDQAASEGELSSSLDGTRVTTFADVNADGRVSPADALGVINALSRGEAVEDPLIELYLNASDLNGQLLTPDEISGALTFDVGEQFNLEVGYRDLRPFDTRDNPPDGPSTLDEEVAPVGLFQLVTDIVADQQGFLRPVMYEVQTLSFPKAAVRATSDVTDLLYSNGIGGDTFNVQKSTITSEAAVLQSYVDALTFFGYDEGVDFEVDDLSAGDNYVYRVMWSGEFDNVDLPDVLLDLAETSGDDFVATTDSVSPLLFGIGIPADGQDLSDDVQDGQVFTISRGASSVTYELDFDQSQQVAGSTLVSIPSRTVDAVADAMVDAINPNPFGLIARNLGNGRVELISAEAGVPTEDVVLDLSGTVLSSLEADGELNPASVIENLQLESRTNDGDPYYGVTGELRPYGNSVGGDIVGIGGLGPLADVVTTTDFEFFNGFTGEYNTVPFHAYSFRYEVAAPVVGLNVRTQVSEFFGDNGEEVLVYGQYKLRDDPANLQEDTSKVPQDLVAQGTTAVLVINAEGDAAGVLSISPESISVDEDEGTVQFTVTRSAGSAGQVSVDFAAVDGTAAAGSDYTLTGGTLTFKDGDLSETITANIINDDDIENEESFTVVLSNPTGGATLGTDTSTVRIIDNDVVTPGVLAFSVESASVNEDDGTITLTVNRTGGSDGAVTVDYATADGSATAGEDYTAQSDTLTFAENDTSETITIAITDDMDVESNETFTVSLSNPTGGATLGANTTVTVTIIEDDVPGALAFEVANADVSEDGNQIVLTVLRTGGDAGTVTVDYATADGTATAGADYTAASDTLTFAAGVPSQTITIGIIDDVEVEPNETFTVALSNPTGGATLGANSTATVTILEDDVPGELAFDVASVDVDEDAGTVTLKVQRTNGNDGEVTVDFATSDGTAVAGQDYVGQSDTLTFANGEATAEITIQITDDSIIESDENFTVTLSNPGGGASLGAIATATVTILEDDVAIAFDANSAQVDEDAGTVTLNVVRTGSSRAAVSVDYATVDGTAVAGDDYVSANATLDFDAGVNTLPVTIQITDDKLDEPNETFAVQLSNPTNGAVLGAIDESTVTIIDDDVAGELGIQATATVGEQAGSVSLTVTRSGGSDGQVTVQFATSDGTADAGLDYTGTSGMLTFPDGVNTRTIDVPILDDADGNEPDETFFVTLSNPTGAATLGNVTATVTIVSVNEPPVVGAPVEIAPQSEEAPAFTVSEADLLAGSSDREGDTLSVSNLTFASGDARGVTINADSLLVDPAAYGFLTDGDSASAVYTYSISDGVNDPVSQTVTITIDGFNDPPVARNDAGATFAGVTVNIDVLDNDDAGDGEDQVLTVTQATSDDGTVVIQADGSLDFTPAVGFVGQATIQYTIQDSQGKTDAADVLVAVEAFSPSSISGSIFIDNVENLSEILNGADPIRNGIKEADEDGIGGVEVRLYSAANENATGEIVDETVLTDLEGGYKFDGLAPGTYRVIFDAPSTIIYLGAGENVATIGDTGAVDLAGVNFPVLGTQGSSLDNVDILASSYLRTNATIDDLSNGGREGGLVSFDADGNQEFLIAFSGYDDVKFAELAMSNDGDSAILTIIEDDGDVMSALLSSDHFVVSHDERGVQFFGGMNDFDFREAGALPFDEDDFPTYRDAVDRILADL